MQEKAFVVTLQRGKRQFIGLRREQDARWFIAGQENLLEKSVKSGTNNRNKENKEMTNNGSL